MHHFEASFWKLSQINRKLQRIFLTGINYFNYEFEEDDEDDYSDDEEEVDCQVQQQEQV
jgi:hypothetical protein